ncbi:ArsR/SmtB family transcription factor, partial [Rhodococcus sp. NPDC058514]|uniref:ArsR/SmtB family transcription factor n=1 Tax=Rhodococcus sp. NPDC058514 TaxID=3346532 RepID=UPI003651FEF9
MNGHGGESADDDRVFKALSSRTRRRMLDVLKDSPCMTGELCAHFPELDRTTVLQHLRVLERAALVTGCCLLYTSYSSYEYIFLYLFFLRIIKKMFCVGGVG